MSASIRLGLVIAAHGDHRFLDRRVAPPPGFSLRLGRGGHALGRGGLDDKKLSRDHAEIDLHGDRLEVEDLGSTNGTFVNGQRIEGRAVLSNGDVVGLGNILLLCTWVRSDFRLLPADVRYEHVLSLEDPISERLADIPALARGIAEEAAGRPLAISRRVMLALLRHPWVDLDGLREVVSELASNADGDRIRELPEGWTSDDVANMRNARRPEPDELRAALIRLGGNVKVLAGELGAARTTLSRWFAEDGIDPEAIRKSLEAE
jgi:hypothetical protein